MPTRGEAAGGLRFTPWNLLLLLPFLMLVTPWFNTIEPRLFGMPFFYWVQFVLVVVGVVSRGDRLREDPRRVEPRAARRALDVDELDEGTRRGGPAMITGSRSPFSPCCSSSSPSWASWPRAGSAAETLDHLDEWGLGGRKFGSWITWFLVGGDLYTAYTFVAVPALLFGAGAMGFFALPYTVILYPLVFLPVLRLWSVSRVHGYVTPADFVRGRYGSSLLALIVAITGLVATMPYIALQLVGPRGGAAHDGAQRRAASSATCRCSSRSSSWRSTPTSRACGRPR